MKKCPECGVKHKHQRSAQGCYQLSRSIIDHLIISGGEVNRYEQERADKMKKYYNSLPYPKDILKRLKL
jgi:hypothetical protein